MSALSYIQREHDPDGNLIRAAQFDPVIDVSTLAEWPGKGMFINADMQRNIMPAWRQQAVNVIFQANNELIKDGDFPARAFAAGQPLYWTGDAQVEMIDVEALGLGTTTRQATTGTDGVYRTPARLTLNTSGQFAMAFTGSPAIRIEEAKSRVSDPTFIAWEPDMEMQISFDYFVRSIVGYYKLDCILHYEVKVGNQYLSAEPLQWQKAQKRNPIFVSVNDYDAWKTYKINTPPIPAYEAPIFGLPAPPDAGVTIRIYQAIVYNPQLYPAFENLYRKAIDEKVSAQLIIDNASAKLVYRGAFPRTEDRRTYLNNAQYTRVPEELIIHHADPPEYRNRELIYPYAWRIQAGTIRRLTSLWRRKDYPEAVRLVDLILQTVVDASRKPTVAITGTINHIFGPVAYIRINYYGNRIFKVNGYAWNVKARKSTVELLEVLTGLPLEANFILMEDGRLILSEIDQNNEFLPIPLE